MHFKISKLLLTLIAPIFVLSATQTFAIQIDDTFVTPNAGGYPEWVAAIDSAKSELNLAMYNMRDQGVIDALKRAAKRNVKVNVLFDLNNSKKPKQATMLTDLTSAGVNVVVSSPIFTISHQKTLTIDGKKALITTMNLMGYSKTTRGYGVVVSDTGIVAEMDRVFAQDLINAKNGTGLTPITTEPALLWSPYDGAQKLANLIDSARKTIVVEVENISYPLVIDALIRAQDVRKVQVKIITPLCGFGDDKFFNIPTLQKLAAVGVEARVMEPPGTAEKPFIHAKMITVDGERSYIGSLNFTYNSLLSARELGIIFDDAKAVGTITTEFQKDWTQAIPVPSDTSKVVCP